jgi:hypothetical protein
VISGRVALQRPGVRLAARPKTGEAQDRVELDRVRRPAGDVVLAVPEDDADGPCVEQMRIFSHAAGICLRL